MRQFSSACASTLRCGCFVFVPSNFTRRCTCLMRGNYSGVLVPARAIISKLVQSVVGLVPDLGTFKLVSYICTRLIGNCNNDDVDDCDNDKDRLPGWGRSCTCSSYYSCYCCEGSSLSLVTCTPTGMRLVVCGLVKYFCLHQRCFTQGGVLG